MKVVSRLLYFQRRVMHCVFYLLALALLSCAIVQSLRWLSLQAPALTTFWQQDPSQPAYQQQHQTAATTAAKRLLPAQQRQQHLQQIPAQQQQQQQQAAHQAASVP
jgi:hypothetical protein